MRKTSLVLLFLVAACGNDRIAKLEKQVAALEAQVGQLRQSSKLELQAKCSKDAREWYGHEWSADKDTILLSYTNHYSARLNKCFITVNWNYNLGQGSSSVQKNVLVYDVYENSKVGEYSELHMLILDKPKVNMGLCSVSNVKCSSYDDFTKTLEPYLTQ